MSRARVIVDLLAFGADDGLRAGNACLNRPVPLAQQARCWQRWTYRTGQGFGVWLGRGRAPGRLR